MLDSEGGVRPAVAGALRPQNFAAAIAGLTVFLQLSAMGANTGYLAVAAAVMNIVACAAIIVLVAPPLRFWLYAAPVLALLAAALLWAIYPDLTAQAGNGGAPPGRLAHDVLDVQVSHFFGFGAALVLGALVGHRRGLMRTALSWILGFAALNLAIGLVLRQLNPGQVWGVARPVGDDRFSGTLLNANAAACVFGMVAVLAAGKWLALRHLARDPIARERRVDLSGLAAVLMVAAAGACIIAASRTAVTLVALGLVVLFASEWLAARGRIRPGMALAGAGLLVAVGAVALFAGEIVTQRTTSIGSDALDRVAIWDRFWTLASQAPWSGYGLGSFSDVNLSGLGDAAEARRFWYINDAHNIVLRLLMEGGWPYLLLIAAALGLALFEALAERRRQGSDPEFRAVLIALGVALGCGMVDIALSVPAIVSLATLLVGLAWGRALRVRMDRFDFSRAGAADRARR